MNVSVCPADTVRAPAEVVWRMLTEDYGAWAEGRVESISPPGPPSPGQVVVFASPALGLTFRLRFEVVGVDAQRHRLGLDVRLPLGIVNHEMVTIDPTPEGGSLVRFN